MQPCVAESDRGHWAGGRAVDDLEAARIEGAIEHAIEGKAVDRFSQ